MLMSDPQKRNLLGPTWKPRGTHQLPPEPMKLSHNPTDSSNTSPTLAPDAGSHSICPAVWMAPRRRKAGGRLSMMDIPLGSSWDGLGDFSAQVPFPHPSTLLPCPPVAQLTLQIRTEVAPPAPKVTDSKEALYKPLSDEEEDRALDLNEQYRKTLKKLEKEIPGFSLREAICNKPSVSMRPPKKSKLMERRSLGF